MEYHELYGEDMDAQEINELQSEIREHNRIEDAVYCPHLDDPQVQAEMRACGY